MRTSLFVLFCLILPAGSACAEEVLLSPGGKTEWSYLDGNANPGEDWANPGFDDSQWKKGKAPLGYGKEVARANLEAGKLTSRTTAPRAIRESSELVTRVPAATLKFEAVNTVAVEVHQSGPTSSDLYLDLRRTGLAAGEKPASDPCREGMRALRRGKVEEGTHLLSQISPDHPEYARTLVISYSSGRLFSCPAFPCRPAGSSD